MAVSRMAVRREDEGLLGMEAAVSGMAAAGVEGVAGMTMAGSEWVRSCGHTGMDGYKGLIVFI